jgi:hypothetical protein
MENAPDVRLPQAQNRRLTMRDLDDELVVYDGERHQAHRLNRTAALVWQHCDGRTTLAEMATRLHQELDLPADESLVWLALDRLEKAHLLQGPLTRPETAGTVTRRHAIQRLARAGGLVVLLPVVTSIVAPKAAWAGSGSSCGTGSQGQICGFAGQTIKRCCANRGSGTLQCVPEDSPSHIC